MALLLTACGGDDDLSAGDEAPESVESTADEASDDSAASADAEAADGDPADESTSVGDEDATADGSSGDDASEELFPDVLGATAARADDGTWTFSATLSSPYDTPQRYADAWRVLGPDGEVYGIRELAHDHANEQPFTRSQSGIEIPAGVTTVTVEGRDQVSGWGGDTVEVVLEP